MYKTNPSSDNAPGLAENYYVGDEDDEDYQVEDDEYYHDVDDCSFLQSAQETLDGNFEPTPLGGSSSAKTVGEPPLGLPPLPFPAKKLPGALYEAGDALWISSSIGCQQRGGPTMDILTRDRQSC